MKKSARHAAMLAALLAPCALFADYAKEFAMSFPGYRGTTELTNFPVLVRLSKARNDFDYASCRDAEGGDVRFFNADGVTLLPSQVDTWDPSGESLVWVRVPRLTDKTNIVCRYGSASPDAVTATDVWSEGYVGVWHMNGDPTTLVEFDSSTGTKKLAPKDGYSASMLGGVDGKVGKAVEFGRDGLATGGLVLSNWDNRFDSFGAFTIETWTYQDNHDPESTPADGYIARVYSNPTSAWSLYETSGTGKIGFLFTKNGASSSTWISAAALDVPSRDAWHYHSIRWDGSTGAQSRDQDAARVGTTSVPASPETMATVTGGLYVGNNLADQWGKAPFRGKIDELRISRVFRSDDWVTATRDTIENGDFAVAVVPNNWTKYARKFSVSFPGVADGATLTDFPVLVKISESGISGFRYADCAKEGGADLRFADANGTLLPCEVEVWNPEGESLVWVKVPTLTKDTRITGHYGWNLAPVVESTEVWDEHFLAVWHMDAEEGSLSQLDSTANEKTATCPADCASGVQSGVDGKLGKAARFGLANNHRGGFGLSDPDNHFDGLGEITVEAWTYRDVGAEVPTANAAIVEKSRYDSEWKYAWSMYEQKNNEKNRILALQRSDNWRTLAIRARRHPDAGGLALPCPPVERNDGRERPDAGCLHDIDRPRFRPYHARHVDCRQRRHPVHRKPHDKHQRHDAVPRLDRRGPHLGRGAFGRLGEGDLRHDRGPCVVHALRHGGRQHPGHSRVLPVAPSRGAAGVSWKRPTGQCL